MARGLPQQREIADLLTAPGTELCDLGCGPGVLGGLLAQRHQQLRLHLVDPSPVMRSQAARRCRQWQSAGRVEISAGTADQLPLADGACDTVVSVNTVVMWPDLAAGLHEIKRVLRPDGRLVLSWHSATAPSRTSRRLALSDDVIRTLSDALHATFGDFQRHDLTPLPGLAGATTRVEVENARPCWPARRQSHLVHSSAFAHERRSAV